MQHKRHALITKRQHNLMLTQSIYDMWSTLEAFKEPTNRNENLPHFVRKIVFAKSHNAIRICMTCDVTCANISPEGKVGARSYSELVVRDVYKRSVSQSTK